jgi:hypothetical protein
METNGHEGLIKQGRVYTKNFRRVVVGSPLVILVGGTSNIIPFRRPFFFLIQLVVVLI